MPGDADSTGVAGELAGALSSRARVSPATLREYQEYYRTRPIAFALDVLKREPDIWQRKTLRSVFLNQKTAVAGATGVGKDSVAAMAVCWFTFTHPYSKIICTAANESVLRDNLFSEIATCFRGSPIMGALFRQGDLTIIPQDPVVAKEWFVVGRVAAARQSSDGMGKQSEGLAGRYGVGGTLTVVDEASGVEDSHFDAIEGSASRADRQLLYIGNPLRRKGRFADTFLKPAFRNGWYCQHVSYLDSVYTSGTPDLRAQREDWIRKHGMNSVYVQARVFGRFPTQSSIDNVMTSDQVLQARERGKAGQVPDSPSLPVCIGVDVARYGDDEMVLYARRGLKSLGMVVMSKASGPEGVARCVEMANRYVKDHPDYGSGAFDPRKHVEFRVDQTGMGGIGIVDPLRELGWQVAGVDNGASSSPFYADRYKNLGTELWCEDMADVIDRVSIVDDDLLADQLETRRYRYTGGDLKTLHSKDYMRSKGLTSPDRADACVLAFAPRDKLEFGPADVQSKIFFI